MSTKTAATASADERSAVGPPLSLKELAVLMVKHYGLHEGHYDLMIEYKIGTGIVQPDPNEALPGAMIAISRVALVKSDKPEGAAVDAATANPARKVRKKAPA